MSVKSAVTVFALRQWHPLPFLQAAPGPMASIEAQFLTLERQLSPGRRIRRKTLIPAGSLQNNSSTSLEPALRTPYRTWRPSRFSVPHFAQIIVKPQLTIDRDLVGALQRPSEVMIQIEICQTISGGRRSCQSVACW